MTDCEPTGSCTAFRASRQIAAGALDQIALKLSALAQDGHVHGVLIFDDLTGQQIDIDLRGSQSEVLARLGLSSADLALPEVILASPTANLPESAMPARPGRPKLGVVAREVTLLPRHWQWLGRQPGGASVALRKLVDEARRAGADKEIIRQAQEAAYKFMSAMAGNQEGFEEAARALFARNETDFAASTASWPADIGRYAKKLAAPALQIS
jgi:hypothetical protein